jgi:hypothetical protein
MDIFKTENVELAIDVLKTQRKALVNSLKDYLTFYLVPSVLRKF